MQILCSAIHLYPAALGAWLSQLHATSAPGEPSWPVCVLQWFFFLAGHSKALLAAFVPLAATNIVSLLARSRVGSSGLLVQATRLREMRDARRETWPAGEGDHGGMQSDHEGSRCAEAVRD